MEEKLTSAEKKFKKYGWIKLHRPVNTYFAYGLNHGEDNIIAFDLINGKWCFSIPRDAEETYIPRAAGETYLNQEMVEAILARIKELNAKRLEEEK